MEDNSLQIENLHVSYGKLEVLKGVDIAMAPHDFVALIGANGAGKSTALKAIAGLIPLQKGIITLGKEDISSLFPRDHLLKGIAYVPQGGKVFGSVSVKDNLELLSEKYDHVLELFPNLKNKLYEKAGTLSGGEQQMLSIARALLLKPKYLLLDEPSLGLSPLFVEHIFELLKKINKEDHVGILVVEQNVTKALEHAHFGYLLELGKIKQTVTKEDLDDPAFKKTYLGV